MENIEYKSIAFSELNLDEEKGIFTGYASTFGNTDLVNDIIEKGAFMESLQKNKIKLLWQHEWDKPIGIVKAMEDEKGLYVEASLNLDTQLGKEAYSLLKQGALDSMSIGFRVKKDEIKENIRVIKQVDLHEVSIVTFPANPSATVNTVKSVSDIPAFENIRALEDYLRDSGYSKNASMKFISEVKKLFTKQNESDSQPVIEIDLESIFTKHLENIKEYTCLKKL